MELNEAKKILEDYADNITHVGPESEAIRVILREHEMLETHYKFVDNWLHMPYPSYEELFQKIEKALGFRLFTWQKTFIISGEYRRIGDTTARSIKQLLEDKEIELQIPPRNARQRFEQKELLRIYDMLKPTGLIKAKVKVRGREYGSEA